MLWSLLVMLGSVSSFAHGQSGLAALDAAAPPALPVPNILERYVFEQPLMPALLTIAVAVIIAIAIRHKKKAAVAVSVCGVVMGAGIFIIGNVVVTPREELLTHARNLVGATATGDAQQVESMLTSDAVLYLPHFTAPERLDRILSRVRGELARGGAYEVREHRLREVQAHVDSGASGRVQLKVNVTLQSSGYPIPSWWRLDLERDAENNWRTSGISLLSIGGGLGR